MTAEEVRHADVENSVTSTTMPFVHDPWAREPRTVTAEVARCSVKGNELSDLPPPLPVGSIAIQQFHRFLADPDVDRGGPIPIYTPPRPVEDVSRFQ